MSLLRTRAQPVKPPGTEPPSAGSGTGPQVLWLSAHPHQCHPVTLGHPTSSIHIPLHHRITYALLHTGTESLKPPPANPFQPITQVTLARVEAQGTQWPQVSWRTGPAQPRWVVEQTRRHVAAARAHGGQRGEGTEHLPSPEGQARRTAAKRFQGRAFSRALSKMEGSW